MAWGEPGTCTGDLEGVPGLCLQPVAGGVRRTSLWGLLVCEFAQSLPDAELLALEWGRGQGVGRSPPWCKPLCPAHSLACGVGSKDKPCDWPLCQQPPALPRHQLEVVRCLVLQGGATVSCPRATSARPCPAWSCFGSARRCSYPAWPAEDGSSGPVGPLRCSVNRRTREART